MKHAAKEQKTTKKQKQIRLIIILSVLFLLALAGAAITIYRDYQARPGFLEKVWVSERGADYLIVSWDKVRNVERYVVTCNGKTVEASGRADSAKVDGLKEDSYYEVSVRADSREREGFEAVTAEAWTKKATHISGEDEQIKLPNRPTDLGLTAETRVIYKPGPGYSVTPEGKILFTGTGEVTVTAETEATEEYASSVKEIKVTVLDFVNVDPKNAEPHIIYSLDRDNCEYVMAVSGNDKAIYPQSFAYLDGEYIICFIQDNRQRIVTYGSEKNVYKPEMDLGHANGLTVAGGSCYSVRGYGSTICVVFDPPNSNYGSFELQYGASGIAYDPVTGMFFTSSNKRLVAYDSGFNVVKKIRTIKHKGTYYVQDCGAYGGILMHCVSGEDMQGTNYIDFYDMEAGKYLGTAKCELNEIESLIVDDEGYIELLSLGRGGSHCIWKTPINMKKLL